MTSTQLLSRQKTTKTKVKRPDCWNTFAIHRTEKDYHPKIQKTSNK